jgi:hypothetical protein
MKDLAEDILCILALGVLAFGVIGGFIGAVLYPL